MQIATQIIAQRATPATRTTTTTTKTRWQPYLQPTASTSALPCRSPLSHTLPAPTTNQTNISDPSTSRACLSAPAQTAKDPIPSKQKYAIDLIDQAVHTLADIWRPQDIPKVFLPPRALGKQPALTTPTQPSFPHTLPSTNSFPQNATGTDQATIPLKTFVHEVLKRSRTSGTVLQTALCYLEALRVKVPELLKEEKMGVHSHFQSDSVIQPATAEELAREAELAASEIPYAPMSMSDCLKTVRVDDLGSEEVGGMEDNKSEKSMSFSSASFQPPSTPTPASLPSPLLCPRRAFLASLILASKFSQDKCYSNRAWAKLSGLPPREVGRCERALGQVLDWRLWVGKATQSQASTTGAVRPVARAQSEESLSSPSANFLVPEQQDRRALSAHQHAGIRRCTTAPESSFAANIAPSVSSSSTSSYSSVEEDQYMAHLPEVSKYEYSIASSSSASSTVSEPRTPSPETPGLTYSPTSSTSSGDQIVQLSTFEENFTSSQLWVEGCDARPSVAQQAIAAAQSAQALDNKRLSSIALGYQARPHVTVVDPESIAYSEHRLWCSEPGVLSLEATPLAQY
ncbi:hypothetical protein D9613_000402 [Agrocybe pediades]|uniref:Uncharacterized protein n=1 Tax=Agrocybe pediades TaxID=84607 RepID=A0A8H4R1Y8_9AGAR|nr:hypothetical protein D9613_000402 [Agrocybe pediades]